MKDYAESSGTFYALADMMAREVVRMSEESHDPIRAQCNMKNLLALARQFEEAKQKFGF